MLAPQRRSDVIAERIGQETILRDPIKNLVHVINASAAWIWERLDGTSSVEEIASELAGRHGLAAEDARRDVTSVTDAFRELGLLT